MLTTFLNAYYNYTNLRLRNEESIVNNTPENTNTKITNKQKQLFHRKYSDKKVGKVFEEKAFDTLMETLNNKNSPLCKSKSFESTINTKLDKEQGTDFICKDKIDKDYKIRHFDLTLNFNNKKFVPYAYESNISIIKTKNMNTCLKFGINHGNNWNTYTGFDDPVIVVGADIPPKIYKQYADNILKNIRKNAQKIISTGIVNADPEKRTSIKDELQKNNKYVQPKNIENRYKDMIQMVDEMLHDAQQEQDDSETIDFE